MRSLFILIILTLVISACSKETSTTEIEYHLETTKPTGDHFYVSYTNENGDTISEHQHYGWKYTFKTTKPFGAFFKTEVNPIDVYVLTTRIVANGNVVKEGSLSTATAGNKILSLSFSAH
jgi:hypothetical protein